MPPGPGGSGGSDAPDTDPSRDTPPNRRLYVLGALALIAGLVAAWLLAAVLATVAFAITTAFILAPVRRRLDDRGLADRTAAAGATTAGFVGTALVLGPPAAVVLLRVDDVLAALSAVPETLTIAVAGVSRTVVVADVLAVARRWLTATATRAAAAMPTLAVKSLLFVLVVYALLYHERTIRARLFALVPSGYHDVADALAGRATRTLYAIYVLQAATAFATFLVAVPTFFALGYRSPFALATLAGLLQFIPVVGPSVLILGLAAYHLAVSDPLAAALVATIGLPLIGAVPDVVIRPRLARRTANISGGLYLIGFVGGVLTVGPIGIIVGPLAVAIALEAAGLLSAELAEGPVAGDPPGEA